MEAYQYLLATFQEWGYSIITCREMDRVNTIEGPVLVLRHDVDDHPRRALAMAQLEQTLGISASYYFRYHPSVFNKTLIRQIYHCGHEVGYHYETLSKSRGNRIKAIDRFQKILSVFREICPIETISPHGSPLSRYDNQKMWESKEYRQWGITMDISMDTDFNRYLYLTETGRSWNSPYNRRDKIESEIRYDFRKTVELAQEIQNGRLPSLVMINIHPQRWTDNSWDWHLEKWGQAVRNLIKYILFQKFLHHD